MIKELFRTTDEEGDIVVIEQGNSRILSFSTGLQQSRIQLEKPYCLQHEYSKIMLLGLLFVDAKKVTILGLGGGGFAHCLGHYFPDISLIAIEIRQRVIDVGYQWFFLSKLTNLTIYCDDASHYILDAEPLSVDMIFSDLYIADGMSELQKQQSFIKNSQQVLTSDGVLVINFHTIPVAHSSIMKTIELLFSNTFVCDVFKGNFVMFCCNSEFDLTGVNVKNRLKLIEKKLEMPLTYFFKKLKKIYG